MSIYHLVKPQSFKARIKGSIVVRRQIQQLSTQNMSFLDKYYAIKLNNKTK